MGAKPKPAIKKRNWVLWLEEQSKKRPPTPEEKYVELCLNIAKDLGKKYKMDDCEVIVSDKSVHFNFKKDNSLFLNIIPRSIIIKTCKITPHVELAIKKQLYRLKKQQDMMQ